MNTCEATTDQGERCAELSGHDGAHMTKPDADGMVTGWNRSAHPDRRPRRDVHVRHRGPARAATTRGRLTCSPGCSTHSASGNTANAPADAEATHGPNARIRSHVDAAAPCAPMDDGGNDAMTNGWHRKNPTPASTERIRQYRSREHRDRRKQEQRKVDAGTALCWRCGHPIPRGTPWHLGHDDNDRSLYRGAEHPTCNLKAAASKGARIRNTQHGRPSHQSNRTRWTSRPW